MISVVIPTHNRADLLPRAIESACAQTYTDIEVIVVSDGSTDDTKQVVESIAANDSRVRFIEYHPARGGNVARNTGVEAAGGEFVAFLDDDDAWYPEKLEKQLAIMQSDARIGLVYTGVKTIFVNEGLAYSSNPKCCGDLHERILLNNCVGSTSTVMVRRALFEKTGLFDEQLKALQDYDLWIRFCQHAHVGVVSEEMIDYYNYTGKKQVSAVTQKYVDAFAHINSKYAYLFAGLSDELKTKKLFNEYIDLSHKCMRNANKKQARSYALAAMKTSLRPKALVYFGLSFFDYKTILKLRRSFR